MPQDPTERRVTVTGPPRRTTRASGYYRPRTEIDEQTTLGHTYVRSLMRSQLRAGLAAFAVLGLLVGPLPLLFAAMPDARRLEWAVLGFGLYAPSSSSPAGTCAAPNATSATSCAWSRTDDPPDEAVKPS